MTACINSESWYDPAEFFVAKMVKARKSHVCTECGATIRKGSLYERATGKWEGYSDSSHSVIETYKTCARCVNIRTDYFQDYVFTRMVEDFRETHGFDYRKGLPSDSSHGVSDSSHGVKDFAPRKKEPHNRSN